MSDKEEKFIGEKKHWEALKRICDKYTDEDDTEENAIDFLNDLMKEVSDE